MIVPELIVPDPASSVEQMTAPVESVVNAPPLASPEQSNWFRRNPPEVIFNPDSKVEVAGPVTLMFPLIPRVVPGLDVPMPTLPSPAPLIERIGSSDVDEVAKLKALS